MGETNLLTSNRRLHGMVFSDGCGNSVGFDESFITITQDITERTIELTPHALAEELKGMYAVSQVTLHSEPMELIMATNGNWLAISDTRILVGKDTADIDTYIELRPMALVNAQELEVTLLHYSH